MAIFSKPIYNKMTFSEIYNNVDDFMADYNNVGIPPMLTEADNARTLFYLLYARYGNSPIVYNDLNQFKYQLFSKIFQYGPSWEKRLEMQNRLRELSEDEFLMGAKQINNQAYNPSSEPSTDTTDEINYINQQLVQKNSKGILDGYNMLMSLIRTDVTSAFLDTFKRLFKTFVDADNPLIYVTEEDEEDE